MLPKVTRHFPQTRMRRMRRHVFSRRLAGGTMAKISVVLRQFYQEWQLEDIFAPLFTTPKGYQAGWTLAILMAVFILMTMSHLIHDAWSDAMILRHGAAAKVGHGEAVTTQQAQRISELPKQHVFGQSVNDGGMLPITSLQLRLTGVVKSSQNTLSRAIISEAGQSGKVYHVGDRLPSGITVYAIDNNGVILARNGQLEKLPLIRSLLSFRSG